MNIDSDFSISFEINSRKGKIILAIILFIVINMFLAMCFSSYFSENNGYVDTIGVVVDNESVYNYADNTYHYNAVVEYVVDGQSYKIKHINRTEPCIIGEEFDIEYQSNDPDDARFKKKDYMLLVLYISTVLANLFPVIIFISGLKTSKHDEIISRHTSDVYTDHVDIDYRK